MQTARGTVEMHGKWESIYTHENILGKKRQGTKPIQSHPQSCRITAVCQTAPFSELKADQVCSRSGDDKREATMIWKWGQNTSVDGTASFIPKLASASFRVRYYWKVWKKQSSSPNQHPFLLLLENTYTQPYSTLSRYILHSGAFFRRNSCCCMPALSVTHFAKVERRERETFIYRRHIRA